MRRRNPKQEAYGRAVDGLRRLEKMRDSGRPLPAGFDVMLAERKAIVAQAKRDLGMLL